MSKIQTLLNLNGLITGQSDPVAISVNPILDVEAPMVTSGGMTTDATTNLQLFGVAAPYNLAETYLYVRNSGSSGGGGGTGNIIVTDAAGNEVIFLIPGDFCFLPIKKATGAKIKYDTAATDVVWAYFKRQLP